MHFLVLFIPMAATAQVMGGPGVPYKGGLKESDICLNGAPPSQTCASYVQQIKDGSSSIGQKLYFTTNCDYYFKLIDGIGSQIAAKKQECSSVNEKTAALIGSSSTGDKAIADAKTLADTSGKSLANCSSAMTGYQSQLQKIQNKLDERIKSLESNVNNYAQKVATDKQFCAAENQTTEVFSLENINARYKFGLSKLVSNYLDAAGFAMADYKRGSDFLNAMAANNGSHAAAMKTVDPAMDALLNLAKKNAARNQ